MKGGKIEGDNGCIILKPALFDIIWTETPLTSITDTNGHITGYEETTGSVVPQIPSAGRVQPDKLDRSTKRLLLARLEDLAQYDFDQVETYINNNVTDLASARNYLIKLSKVNLAVIKLLQDKL